MKTWQKDKKWSDQFIKQIKRNLGEHLIGEPPVEEDQKHNTDLIVLHMAAKRIACRIRREEYIKYKEEFTIRVQRPSKAETELAKLISGWGDYLFYGFGGEDGGLIEWRLADLNVFRLWHSRKLAKGIMPGVARNNKDGSSSFRAYKWQDLPGDFIIAQERRQ
jgi:hypothetical protein